MSDLIDRQAVIDEIKALYEWHDTVTEDRVIDHLMRLPSAQPEKRTEKHTETHACDLISRQAAIDALCEDYCSGHHDCKRYPKCENLRAIQELPSAQPEQNPDEWCTDCKEYDGERHCCPRFNRVIRTALEGANKWIPCAERLPEEDADVLIAYRHKEGEGDTSHTEIDIASYGDMYFGGNPVHDSITGNRIKHWRQPFAYFTSNYEVIAWMPLPEPYEPEEQDANK